MVSSVPRYVARRQDLPSPPFVENGLPGGRLSQEEPHPGRSHVYYSPWRASNRGVLQSIVPEVDEDEEEATVNTLSVAFPHPEESPKNLKRKRSLVELVIVSVHLRVASSN